MAGHGRPWQAIAGHGRPAMTGCCQDAIVRVGAENTGCCQDADQDAAQDASSPETLQKIKKRPAGETASCNLGCQGHRAG